MTNVFDKINDLKNPTKFVVLGFLFLILLGASLLTLPISSVSRETTPFVDALFTATSASCVTGLTVVQTASHWSVFGKVVILFLIQLGGLGIMSIASLGFFITGQRVSLRGRLAMRESLTLEGPSGVVKLMKYILYFTLIVELIGAFLLSLVFIPDYGLIKGILYSVFHSISAFCNAGLDIIGPDSLAPYGGNIVMNLSIMMLVIIGGIGFFVIMDILSASQGRKLSLQSRFVLIITAILILGGGLLFFIFEYNGTLGGLPPFEKIQKAFFQSVTTRTAGFSTMDQSKIHPTSFLLTLCLMFIGGSPGSTAGGVKTSTVGVLFVAVFSYLKGSNDVNLMHKRISDETLKRAITIFFIALFFLVINLIAISFSDSHLGTTALFYELVSAIGTVGLSTGITPLLTTVGKFIVIFSMFVGRIGTLSFITLIAVRNKKEDLLRYTKGRINIG